MIDNDDNVPTCFTHNPHTAFLIYPSRSHTHPNAHAHRPPLPACPLTAVLSHWACTPVPLAMLSFPHGRASVNMGETLNPTKHVPLQWNTPLNDPFFFFFSLTPSNSFSIVGFSFHATQPFFSGSTRKQKLVIAALRHSTVLAFVLAMVDARQNPLVTLTRPPSSRCYLFAPHDHRHCHHHLHGPLHYFKTLVQLILNRTNRNSTTLLIDFYFHSSSTPSMQPQTFVPYFPFIYADSKKKKVKGVLSSLNPILSILLYTTCF